MRGTKLTGLVPVQRERRICWDELKKAGFQVTQRGWPDFFCLDPDGNVACVAVKRRRGRRLRKHQIAIMEALTRFGIACYRWDPDDGFTRIMPAEAVPLAVAPRAPAFATAQASDTVNPLTQL